MKSCIEAVRHYFDMRTKNWLNSEPSSFQDIVASESHPKWLCHMVHQAERKRSAYAAQGKRLGRAHTNVKVLEVNTTPDKETAHVTAIEEICWAYNDKQEPAVECRLIVHRQVWRYLDHAWVLTKADETSDGYSFESEDREAEVDVPVRMPSVPWRRASYDRIRASRYADVWWDQFNPRYPKISSDDCTNFISQCLHAGGLPMTGHGNRAKGWWIITGKGKGESWSYSWATSHALYKYLRKTVGATLVQKPSELKIGDLIFYDWNGTGTYHHSTIVTDFDDLGDPLVNAHTDPSFRRPYTYYDSRAWTEQTRYAFVHMPDDLQSK
ncbi:amidase domain-containing protein [Alicyclobacillus dauci]|uniref:Amidase domain-containing protein n=1 Tax=Alicyclobacillus dauci TaxID=1475485 RepID=A0ABY6Z121_9BACL|nr:amidase domain-containing protein [Alicyclobacillus dauci]WAH36570.1 amidase domain-containing protein [Alicyclobacillus dauci]